MKQVMSNLKWQDNFPDSPGVYLMKDECGRIIYVGKANNLQKRLASYFRDADQLPSKTRVLLEYVQQLDYLCTSSEKEALLLESSLIKKHRPKYNIELRDDKSYILFKLDKEHTYPRLSLTRSVKQDRALYFGPFTSARAARSTLQVINRIFPLRKCKSTAFAHRSRPCLQYQMKRCLAPCVFDVSGGDYWQLVYELELFFKGKSSQLVQRLKTEMKAASQDLNFEKAAQKRDQLKALHSTVEQQAVVWPGAGDMDVLNLLQLPAGLGMGLLFVRQGKVLDSRNFYWTEPQAGQPDWQHNPGLDKQKVLRSFLLQFYKKGRFIPERIVLPCKLQDAGIQDILRERKGGRVRLCVARRQKEKKLMEMVRTNVVQHQKQIQDQKGPDLSRLARKLQLNGEPERIEAVDISHFGGQDVRVGQVVFEGGRADPHQYRVYKFPELEGLKDDYQALRSWIARRLRSEQPWPDLVLIDGGKGHLRAAQETLHELMQDMQQIADATNQWQLAAIAKDSHVQGSLSDQVYRPGRKNPLALQPGDATLLFLQHMRDQAHNFALGRQKNARKKRLQSRLQELPGIGPGIARQLWSRFGSLADIIQAEQQELQELPGIGKKKAQQLQQVLREWQTCSK